RQRAASAADRKDVSRQDGRATRSGGRGAVSGVGRGVVCHRRGSAGGRRMVGDVVCDTMTLMIRTRVSLLALGALTAAYAFAPTNFNPNLFAELKWRWIGPLRGGRTKSAQGVASQPNVFYIGVCNGGI